MEQRISLITLGVADLARSVCFYERLGFERSGDPNMDVAFFQLGGMAFALWGREQLAQDCGVEDAGDAGTYGGFALAHNVRSPAEVDGVMAEACAAGAAITREAGETFWGGYSGAFTDPDGHAWEIAHNPHWTIAADGTVRI